MSDESQIVRALKKIEADIAARDADAGAIIAGKNKLIAELQEKNAENCRLLYSSGQREGELYRTNEGLLAKLTKFDDGIAARDRLIERLRKEIRVNATADDSPALREYWELVLALTPADFAEKK